MRETRKSGSEGGGTTQELPTPIPPSFLVKERRGLGRQEVDLGEERFTDFQARQFRRHWWRSLVNPGGYEVYRLPSEAV